MNEDVELLEDDLCIVLTMDGKIKRIYANDEKKYLQNADLVLDWISWALKKKENQIGSWHWHIKSEGDEILGEYLGDDSELDAMYDM